MDKNETAILNLLSLIYDGLPDNYNDERTRYIDIIRRDGNTIIVKGDDGAPDLIVTVHAK